MCSGDGFGLKCSAVQFVFISFAAEQVSPNRRGGQGGRCSAQRGERHHLVLLFFLRLSDLGKSHITCYMSHVTHTRDPLGNK